MKNFLNFKKLKRILNNNSKSSGDKLGHEIIEKKGKFCGKITLPKILSDFFLNKTENSREKLELLELILSKYEDDVNLFIYLLMVILSMFLIKNKTEMPYF